LTGWLVEAKIINSSSDHWLVGDPKLIPVDILAKVQDVRELPKKSRLWKIIRSNTARLFAENSGARLAGIVIWPDDPLFEKKSKGA
jgi:hypothetical protein